MGDIEIRRLTTLAEMRGAVELQKVFWGDDLEATIPAHMLFSLATHGGHVLAAFDGQRMVGVLVGFLGTSGEPDQPAAARLQMVSKRMVVLPEYQGQGIGYHLKCEQRKLALQQNLNLVTWTFDPLLARNAHLNIRKLGAISDTYCENYYGTEAGGNLVTLGASDRLLASWWVTSPRIEGWLDDRSGKLELKYALASKITIINATRLHSSGYVLPPETTLLPSYLQAFLEIPVNYGAIVRDEPSLAHNWRLHTRMLFQQLFGMHFIVTDFIRDSYEGRERAFYLLDQMDLKS